MIALILLEVPKKVNVTYGISVQIFCSAFAACPGILQPHEGPSLFETMQFNFDMLPVFPIVKFHCKINMKAYECTTASINGESHHVKQIRKPGGFN
jgi:hypothetical protein